MEFLTNGKKYTDPRELDAGGEGIIYAIDADSVAKIYHEDLRSKDHRKEKVLALCNSFQNFGSAGQTSLSAAFPQFPTYQRRQSLEDIIGFAMHWFKDAPKIANLGFDLASQRFNEDRGIRLDDKQALAFIYNAFEAVDQLHAARIVLGDVNPGNILYNPATRRPVIIDLDAAQVGSFGCPATLDLYNDPRLEQRPRTICGGLTFDAGTDIFALAVVCFEFWVGVRPHSFRRSPPRPKADVDHKRLGISNLKCYESGHDYLIQHGVTYIDSPENHAIENRLAQLKTLDRRLYDYFVAVFINDERENLVLALPVEDRRHPGFRFLADPVFIEIIDTAEKERKAVQAQKQQGFIQPRKVAPDSDFTAIIDRLTTTKKPAVHPTSTEPKLQPRKDPIALSSFLQHFELGI